MGMLIRFRRYSITSDKIFSQTKPASAGFFISILVDWLGFIGSVQGIKPNDKSRFVKIPAIKVTKDNFLQYAQWRVLLPGEYAVGWLVSSGDRLGVYGVLDGRGVPLVVSSG